MDTGQHRRCWHDIYQTLGQCRRQQYALPDLQHSKHEALKQCWFDAGPASQTVGQNCWGADRPYCVSHIAGCEDIKTTDQLIEPKDD